MSGGGGSRSSSSSRARSVKRKAQGKTGSGAGGTAASGGKNPCEMSFEIDLAGVRSEVLKQIAIHAELEVALAPAGQYQAVVCCLKGTASVVGSLAAFQGLATLIRCISDGNVYTATVLKIEKGTCRVAVKLSKPA